MFIQAQNRKLIINTFAVKKFVVTEDNQIQAVMELATKTKPAVVEVLGEYDSDEKRKAVVKGLMYDMRRREQAFKMPKNHKVNLNPQPPKSPKPQNQQQSQQPAKVEVTPVEPAEEK